MKIMKRLMGLSNRYLIQWIPLAFIITALCGLVYIAVQQDIRLGANEPQVQMVADARAGLTANRPPESLVPKQPIDMSLSTSPFVIIYDESGRVLASSAGTVFSTPTVPVGVLKYAHTHKDNRITWEPSPGVRIAAVIQEYQSKDGSGFVLAGRNLREIEQNENTILQLTGLAWIVTMFGSFCLLILTQEIKLRG